METEQIDIEELESAVEEFVIANEVDPVEDKTNEEILEALNSIKSVLMDQYSLLGEMHDYNVGKDEAEAIEKAELELKQEEEAKKQTQEEKKVLENETIEEKKTEEQQAKREKQLQEHAETELEALQLISENTNSTVYQLENVHTEVLDIKEEQSKMNTSMVEGFWFVGLVIAVAVAMKLFWSNTLKW